MSHGTHEKTDAKAKPLIWFTIGLFIFIFISFIVCIWFLLWMNSWEDPYANSKPFSEKKIHGEPLLQLDEPADYQAFIKEKKELLNSYGWVDKGHGVVHVPIDKAIDLVLEKKKFKTS